MYNALILSGLCFAGLAWLAGILRALFLYFRWLRFQRWYCSWPLLVFANLGPFLFALKPELLDHSMHPLQTILMILFGIGGMCMLIYLCAAGMVHGVLLCDAGRKRWCRLNLWHRVLSLGLVLELLVMLASLNPVLL